MIKRLICWWKGHDIEKAFFRMPVYQYFKKNANGYHVDVTTSDRKEEQWWCHRCYKYVSK